MYKISTLKATKTLLEGIKENGNKWFFFIWKTHYHCNEIALHTH